MQTNFEGLASPDRGTRHEPAARPVRFVIVESGATRVDVGRDGDGEGDGEIVVVGQGIGERPGVFALRVIHRMAGLEASGGRVDRAEVFLGPRGDEQQMAARELIARALLIHSIQAQSLRLVLAVCARPEAAVRHQLLALVEGLITEHQSACPEVRVVFNGPP